MAARYCDEKDQLKCSISARNLPWPIQSEAESTSLFEKFGEVTDVVTITPRYKNRENLLSFEFPEMAVRYFDENDQLKCSISVRNLPWQIQSEVELKSLFKKFGEVTDVVIVTPKVKNRFAFVTFSKEEFAKDAVKAAKSEGVYFSNKRLWIAPKKDRSGMSVRRKEVKKKTRPDLTKILNNECMLYIFTFLDLSNILRCELVCTRWQRISVQSLAAMKEVYVGHGAHMVAPKGLRKILKFAAAALTSLHYDMLGDVGFSWLKKFHLPNVTKFTFNSYVGWGCDLGKIIKTCMPSLKVLGVRGLYINDQCLRQLMGSYPDLEELSVRWTSVSNGGFIQCGSIRKLTITRCRFCDIHQVMSKIGNGLEELHISADRHSETLKLNYPNLKKLTVDDKVAVVRLAYPHDPFLVERFTNRKLTRRTRNLDALLFGNDYHYFYRRMSSHCGDSGRPFMRGGRYRGRQHDTFDSWRSGGRCKPSAGARAELRQPKRFKQFVGLR